MNSPGFAIDLLAVAAGGAIGACARYLTSVAVLHFGGPVGLATAIVNIIGCFLIGLLGGLLAAEIDLSPRVLLVAKAGFLGALTTFSAFGLEAVAYIHDERWVAAAIYVGANVLGGIAAVALAMMLVAALVR